MTTTSRAAGNLQGLVAFAVCLVTAMTVLDTTIANVSLATIAGNLGASQSQSTWVITFYGVANAIVIPITGWLSAVFGAQRLFLFCTAAFVAASLFCGMSNSLGMLIVCRILQGAAAGPPDAAFSEPSDCDFPGKPPHARALIMVDDHGGGTCAWSHSRGLHLRELVLALGVFCQCPGGWLGCRDSVAHSRQCSQAGKGSFH